MKNYSYVLSVLLYLSIITTPLFAAQDDKITEYINSQRKKAAKEKVEEPLNKLEFHGMLYMMGWIGKNTNYAFIYDNDSFLGLNYNFTKKSKVVVDLKVADIFKPSNVFADSEIYGQVDILESFGITDYSLLVKLGKIKKKNEYFGEYAMGIGKDFIADKKVNLDMLNWQISFGVNNPKFPFEINIMSDLDFGHRPAKTFRKFTDWNDKGLSIMTEAKLTQLPITENISYTVGVFYDEQFFVGEDTGSFIAHNIDTIDPNNRTTYIGGSNRLQFKTDTVSVSLGAGVKYFSIKKNGNLIGQDQNGSPILNPTKTKNDGVDFDTGIWLGNYSFMDMRLAYLQVKENQANTQHTIGLETNLYMIPKIAIYMGVAFALEKELINFGEHLKTKRSFYGWDIGIIYTPIIGVLLTTGYQKMVRWDDLGYYYVKATFWW